MVKRLKKLKSNISGIRQQSWKFNFDKKSIHVTIFLKISVNFFEFRLQKRNVNLSKCQLVRGFSVKEISLIIVEVQGPALKYFVLIRNYEEHLNYKLLKSNLNSILRVLETSKMGTQIFSWKVFSENYRGFSFPLLTYGFLRVISRKFERKKVCAANSANTSFWKSEDKIIDRNS